MKFLGSVLYFSKNASFRSMAKKARGQAVYYVAAPKTGQIMCCGNIRPYKEVQVNPEWIQNMVQAFVFVGK